MQWSVTILLLLLSFSGLSTRAQDLDAVQENINTIYSEKKYETEMIIVLAVNIKGTKKPPDTPQKKFVTPPPPPPPPIDSTKKKPPQPLEGKKAWHMPLPPSPLLTMAYIMIGIVLILVIVIPILLLLKLVTVRELNMEGAIQEDGEEQDELALKTKPILLKVDELISQGKLAEAIHLLLCTLVDEICQNIDTRITYSNTTREIIKKAQLPTGMRDAFSLLASSSEKVVFGKYKPDMPMLQYCITAYKSFYKLQYDYGEERIVQS